MNKNEMPTIRKNPSGTTFLEFQIMMKIANATAMPKNSTNVWKRRKFCVLINQRTRSTATTPITCMA